MKKKVSKSLMISVSVLTVVVVATLFMLFRITTTVADLRETVVSENSADAILASAGMANDSVVSVPIAYYDQKMDDCVNLYDRSMEDALRSRQFEWSECDYHNKKLEQGIVDFYLDDNYLPVAKGGNLTSNKGVKADNFKRWFNQVEGLSKSYSGTIKLIYHSDMAALDYENDNFYPLEMSDFSAGELVNRDGRNHLFTLNLGVPFKILASGEEHFRITADDDTFVFVGNKLAVDMGGIHGATTGEFKIEKTGEIYTALNGGDFVYSGITVGKDEDSIVRIFHADRNADESIFKVKFEKMNLNIMNTNFAKNGKDEELQVAYDPADPSYVAPLGESSVSTKERSRSVLTSVIVQFIAFGVLMIFLALMIKTVMRQVNK